MLTIIFTLIPLAIIVGILVANNAAYKAGFHEGCCQILSKMKDLDANFNMRNSHDPNFNKVKREWNEALKQVHPNNLKAPNFYEDIFDKIIGIK